MEKTTLGKSNLEISRLGFGAWQLGGHGWGKIDQKQVAAAVRRALDCGVNFFDTADVYGLGQSESRLSEALGAERRNVVIASKFGIRWNIKKETWKDITPGYMVKALEASLRRLNVDRIPLYYVHWPDGTTPVEVAIIALERQRIAGKIGAIGISNFSAEEVRSAAEVTNIAALQMQCSLINAAEIAKLRPVLDEYRIPVVAYGGLTKGLLSGKFNAETIFNEDDTRHRDPDFQGERFLANLQIVDGVKSVAARLNRTPAQVAIRWLLDSPNVAAVLAGAKTPAQVEENCGAVDWQLGGEDYRELQRLWSSGIR